MAQVGFLKFRLHEKPYEKKNVTPDFLLRMRAKYTQTHQAKQLIVNEISINQNKYISQFNTFKVIENKSAKLQTIYYSKSKKNDFKSKNLSNKVIL